MLDAAAGLSRQAGGDSCAAVDGLSTAPSVLMPEPRCTDFLHSTDGYAMAEPRIGGAACKLSPSMGPSALQAVPLARDRALAGRPGEGRAEAVAGRGHDDAAATAATAAEPAEAHGSRR